MKRMRLGASILLTVMFAILISRQTEPRADYTICANVGYACASSCNEQVSMPTCAQICGQNGTCRDTGEPYMDGCGNPGDTNCNGLAAKKTRTCVCVSYCNTGNNCTPGYTTPEPTCTWPTIKLGPDGCGCYKCGTFSPIVIALTGIGARFSSVSEGVTFDLLATGQPIQMAWPVGGDGWLARDLNNNGKIDSGAELFGTSTRMRNGSVARDGYFALSELDENLDGKVNPVDPEFGRLVIWMDSTRNGVTDAGELHSLNSVGIVALETAYRESRLRDRWGNEYKLRSWVQMASAPYRRLSFDVFPAVQSTPP